MIWHHDLPPDELPLAWARAENVRQAEVYIRPARGYDWPVVFLDDVVVGTARQIARKYSAVVVWTSPQGGCQVWLACAEPLTETARTDAQRWLAQRIGADLGSVSGEHLGRLAGLKNWKRGGTWVNVLAESHVRPWSAAYDASPRTIRPQPRPSLDTDPARRDPSLSGRDWAWVCRALEQHESAEAVYHRLIERARERRRSDAKRYALRTVTRAVSHVHVARDPCIKKQCPQRADLAGRSASLQPRI